MTSIEIIVDCLSPKPDIATLNGLDEDRWDDIVITAIAIGLAPLLQWRLDSLKTVLPPMASAKLAVTRQAHAKRNREIGEQLTELLAACQAHQIDVLVLKGALLAATVYDDPSLRPMNDIDLLFRPEDLPRVAVVLEGLGYAGKHKRAEQGPGVTKHLSTYRRDGQVGATPNPFLSTGADRTIEPHRSLEESWFGLKVDITPGVWERAALISLQQQPAYRLSAVDTVLHLTTHATFHVIMGTSVFVQLYDIRQVVEVWSESIDWMELVHLARKAGAQPFVYAALYWARSLYGIPLPAEPLAELEADCRPDLIAYVHRTNAPELLSRTQQPPLISLKQRLQRGLADRHETARWAGSLSDKWAVWQTALAFHKTDTLNVLKQKLRAEVR